MAAAVVLAGRRSRSLRSSRVGAGTRCAGDALGRGSGRRAVGGSGGVGHDPAPRKRFLPPFRARRACLCGALRGAARLRRDRVPAPREPRRPLPRSRGRPGLGPAGDALRGRWLRGQLRPLAAGPRTERVLVLDRVDSRRGGGARGIEPPAPRAPADAGAGTGPPRRPDAAAPGRGRPLGFWLHLDAGIRPSAGSLRGVRHAPRRSRRCCSPIWRSSPGSDCSPFPRRQPVSPSVRLRSSGDAAPSRRTGRSGPSGPRSERCSGGPALRGCGP